MGFRQILRVLARSRSLRFTIDAARAGSLAYSGVRGMPLTKLRWCGHDVFYRPATTDSRTIYQVLLRRGGKAEYYLPRDLEPRVILDVGSNIGTSILFFHEQFPGAKIFGFEPHPETYRILQMNVGSIPSVEIFNYALGATNRQVAFEFDGADFSRFLTTMEGPEWHGPLTTTNCQIRHAREVIKELGIKRVDLIKIDCEGAEYDVLTALPEEMLRHCKWITGEMHDDSGFKLLALLAPYFDLDLKKRMFAPYFRFHACNHVCVEQLRGKFDRNALQR